MFEKFDKKYIQIGIIVLTILLINLILGFLFLNWGYVEEVVGTFNGAMAPVYVGMIIAYLLNPAMKCLEQKVFQPLMRRLIRGEERQKGMARGLSIVLVIILGLVLLIGLFMLVIPELVNSINILVQNLPRYLSSFKEKIQTADKNYPEYVKRWMDSGYTQIQNWWNNNGLTSGSKLIFSVSDSIISIFSDSIISIFSVFFNFFIGIIISIYLMAGQELFLAQAKRLIYSIFKKKRAEQLLMVIKEANEVFGKFVSGKLLDSLIVGILTFLVLTIFGIPYAILISVLIGVTNVIPFFGQYIGAVPSAFLVFLINPVKGLVFLILIIVIMQVDGNIIGPKILGESIGLGSFWVLFSILIFGSLFGLFGMIVAVPIFALIYRIIKRWSASRLRKKQLPVETKYYL